MPRTYAPELTRFRSLLIGSSLSLGLLTRPPSGSNTGLECMGAGYSRQGISLVESGVMCAANLAPVTFTAAGPWPAMEYFGIYDVGGVLLYWGMLPHAVGSNGGPVTIPAGAAYVDWLNCNTGYNPNIGRPLTAITPITNDLPLASQMIAFAMPAASMNLVTKWARPASIYVIHRASARPESRVGVLGIKRMIDVTRGSTAGFTVTGPNGLAF